jgi:transcriptional regulator with XRE-family HTH domain
MATDICIPLGRRIRSLRGKKGWMQVDLAAHAGLTRETISNIELARKEAGVRSLHAIAGAFSMTLAQLLSGLEKERKAVQRERRDVGTNECD